MDLHQMIAYIEAYISHRTDKQVRINPQSAMSRPDLLIHAYDIASGWFDENNGRVEWVG